MTQPIIHIARIQPKGGGIVYLYLRKIDQNQYTWFQEKINEVNSTSDKSQTSDSQYKNEIQTPITAPNVEEALRLARKFWEPQNVSYRLVNCGFRYTLPERDEHGSNALFIQMVASYSSMNGVYFDEELGHLCIVHAASDEATQLLKRLKSENRLQ